MSDNDRRMDGLRQRFVERCRSDAAELRDHRNIDADRLEEIVHRLSGSAGIFGFPRLSELAEETENALREREPHDDLISAVLAELDAVQVD